MSTETTIQFLGGRKYIKKSVNSQMDFINLARQGLPKGSLDFFLSESLLSNNVFYRALPVSKRTIQRYSPTDKLSTVISELIIELASLYSKGIEVFEDKAKFIEWLNEKNPALSQKPIELIDTTIGIELLKDELGRIEYGVYS